MEMLGTKSHRGSWGKSRDEALPSLFVPVRGMFLLWPTSSLPPVSLCCFIFPVGVSGWLSDLCSLGITALSLPRGTALAKGAPILLAVEVSMLPGDTRAPLADVPRGEPARENFAADEVTEDLLKELLLSFYRPGWVSSVYKFLKPWTFACTVPFFFFFFPSWIYGKRTEWEAGRQVFCQGLWHLLWFISPALKRCSEVQ